MNNEAPFEVKPFLRSLTHRPGVYRMLDAKHKVIYVGKARDLKKRVASYFHRSQAVPKTVAMMGKVARVEVTVANTEAEALLLEYSLIKEHKPRFNILLRDDKSYPYIYASTEHAFPRLNFHRATDYTAKSSERDYWGGAEKFQHFLSDELLPLIERTYRSRADRRVIFGQSIGGQFVLYTALTMPDLFWGHIASNPALHRNLPFFLQTYGKAASAGEQSKLFVGSGSLDDPGYRVPTLEWIEHWSNNDDNPWQLKTMILDGHSHMSAPPASFRQGMTWLFSKD